MVLGILVDALPPFEGRTLPPSDTPLKIASVDMVLSPRAAPGSCLDVEFCDSINGRFNVPVKNLVSVNNQSVSPETFNCQICPGPPGPKFLCGGGTLGPDGLPVIPVGVAGGPVELCFWYCSPEDGSSEHLQFDHLQGLTMALTFDCRLTCLEDSFHVPPDSITAAIDAEFVSFQCDNDPNDGDGCEMILGILVDAFPPFDGRTLPPTNVPLKLACVDLLLPEDADCGDCFQIRFQNGVNGTGKVPVKNLVAAENESFVVATNDCRVCVIGQPIFVRGDCNFDGEVNVADAAMVVSTLFGKGTWRAVPPCIDACDANDDGRLDLGDARTILIYVFNLGPGGMLMLPDPGPLVPGLDPTVDKIGCNVEDCP
jgi:hypothetical protein